MASYTVTIGRYLDKAGKAVVTLQYNHDYQSYRINTGIKVDPTLLSCVYDNDFEHWRFTALRKINSDERKLLQEKTEQLKEVCLRLKEVLTNLKKRSLAVTVEHVQKEYEKTTTVEKPVTEKSLMTWYSEYIAVKEREVGSGINSYRSTFHHLEDFVKDKGIVRIEDLKKEFLESFRLHLIGLELKASTIFKQFKNLRFFLNWMGNEDEEGILRIPKAYRKFTVKARFGDPVGLTIDQFFEFYQLNLSSHPNLERTRDAFVFGVSMGGPRHGDLKRMFAMLAKHGFKLDKLSNTITYFENKTGNAHYEVELNSFGIEILEKYKNNLPVIPGNQIMNRHLRTIAYILRWDELKLIPRYDTFGKLLGVDEMKLKDLFSSKFMRKTAATIDNMLGVPIKTSMKRTGHKTYAAYSRYVDVNKESLQQANQLWDKLRELKAADKEAKETDNGNTVTS